MIASVSTPVRARLNHSLRDAQNMCALTKVGTVLKPADLSGTITDLCFHLCILSYLAAVAESGLLSAKLTGRHESSPWNVNVPLPVNRGVTRFYLLIINLAILTVFILVFVLLIKATNSFYIM